MLTFKPLKHTLIERNKKIKDLRTIVSGVTLAKIGRDETVSSETINKICKYLNCRVQDVIKYERDE